MTPARVFSAADVDRLLDRRELLDGLAHGFVALSAGEVIAPTRIEVAVEKGYSLAMPAYRPAVTLS